MEHPSPPETPGLKRRAIAREDLNSFTVNGLVRWGHPETGHYLISNLVGLTEVLANAVEDAAALQRRRNSCETTAANPMALSKAFAAIGDLASLALYMMEDA